MTIFNDVEHYHNSLHSPYFITTGLIINKTSEFFSYKSYVNYERTFTVRLERIERTEKKIKVFAAAFKKFLNFKKLVSIKKIA